MSLKAVIDFVFNAESALRQLNSFTEKFQSKVEKMSNSSIGKFAKIGTALGGIFSVQKFRSNAEALRVFHERYKKTFNVEEVSKFANMMKLTGTNIEGSLNILDTFQRKLTSRNGLDEWDNLLTNKYGLSPFDKNGQLKNSLQIIEEFIEKYRSIVDQDIREGFINNFLNFFGASGTLEEASLRQILDATDTDYKRLLDDASSMTIISEETLNNMKELNRQTAILDSNLTKVGDDLAKGPLSFVLDKTNKLLEGYNKLPAPAQKGVGYGLAGLMVGAPALGMLGFGFKGGAMIAHGIGSILGMGAGTTTATATTATATGATTTALTGVKAGSKLLKGVGVVAPLVSLVESGLVAKDFAEKGVEGTVEDYKKNWGGLDWLNPAKMAAIGGAWVGEKIGDMISPKLDPKLFGKGKDKPQVYKNGTYTPIEMANKIERNINFAPTYNITVEGNMTDGVGETLYNKMNSYGISKLMDVVNQTGGIYTTAYAKNGG